MNIKGFRRMLFGEKMPDKNDPKYNERYERERGCRATLRQSDHVSTRAVAKVQGFANAHRTLFLVIVFGFAICGLTWNIYRLTVVYCHHPVRRTATEMQDSVLRERHKMLSVPHVRRFDTKESGTERPE